MHTYTSSTYSFTRETLNWGVTTYTYYYNGIVNHMGSYCSYIIIWLNSVQMHSWPSTYLQLNFHSLLTPESLLGTRASPTSAGYKEPSSHEERKLLLLDCCHSACSSPSLHGGHAAHDPARHGQRDDLPRSQQIGSCTPCSMRSLYRAKRQPKAIKARGVLWR